ncbi:MAG: glycine cleavage system protein GcvH [Candidatus Kapaibacteriota bacterium]
MNFPSELKYTKDHEWIKVEGNIGTVGVTEHAQSELGDVVYLDFNDNAAVSAGDTFGTVEAVKTVADLYAPVSGTIIECNTGLNDNPEQVNQDPYGAGWLMKIELSNSAELDGLMDAEAYRALVGA